MTTTKDNLYTRFIRRFYRIEGELDEYILNEINRFGNHMYMLMYSLTILSFLGYFFGVREVVSWAFLILLFLPPHLQKRLAKRLGLDKLETERSDLRQARQQMLKRSFLQAIAATLFLVVLFALGHASQSYRPNFLTEIGIPTCSIVFVVRFLLAIKTNFRKIIIID